MKNASTRRQRGPFPAPEMISLMFRMALAVSLLNTGLTTYLFQKSGMMMGRGMPTNYNPMAALMGASMGGGLPGAESYMQFVAPMQIVIGVALAVGFLTAWTATIAGFLMLLLPMAQTVLLVAAGLPSDPNSMALMAFASSGSAINGVNAANLCMAAVVIWLAAAGKNPLSLDALLFKSRAVQAGLSEEPASAFSDPIPAEVPKGVVKVEYDPDVTNP